MAAGSEDPGWVKLEREWPIYWNPHSHIVTMDEKNVENKSE